MVGNSIVTFGRRLKSAPNCEFEKDTRSKESYEKLRIIALDYGFTGELKWGCRSAITAASISTIHSLPMNCSTAPHSRSA